MIPYKQLYRHDPENGVIGDCCRTVWACLLGTRPELVPHFNDELDLTNEEVNRRVSDWLGSRGFTRIMVAFPDGDLSEILRTVGNLNPDLYYILAGMSRSSVNHVVICSGNEIVHDPSLDNSGIVGPCDDGYYWIEFLGSLYAAVPEKGK